MRSGPHGARSKPAPGVGTAAVPVPARPRRLGGPSQPRRGRRARPCGRPPGPPRIRASGPAGDRHTALPGTALQARDTAPACHVTSRHDHFMACHIAAPPSPVPRAVPCPGQEAEPRGRPAAASDRRNPRVLLACRFKQCPPRDDVRATTQQRSPLPFGHSSPDTELDAIVERVGQAFRLHRAAHADELRAVLRCPLHKQQVRIGRAACRPTCPLSCAVSHISESPCLGAPPRQRRATP
jgi:hypothetical protein